MLYFLGEIQNILFRCVLLLSNGFYLPLLIFENGANLLIYLMKMKIKIGIEVQNTHSVNYGLHGVHITYLRTFVISTIIPQYHEKIQKTSIFTYLLPPTY